MSTNYPHRTKDTLRSQSDAFVQALDLNKRPVINGEPGGNWGWASNIFDYVSMQPHVQQQSWCIVLATPALFSRLPAGNALHSLCKSFFENRTQKFEGLSDRTEINYGEMKWTGHTLSVPTGATRTLGQITHTAYEIEGESFTKMFKIWQQWALMDSEIVNAKAVLLDDPGDLLLDEIGASMIYFEPTKNMRDIAHAQLAVGVMPRTSVPIEMRRDKDDEGQIRIIQMEFTGLIEADTYAVKQLARRMLSLLPMYNPDAIALPVAFQDRTATLVNLKNSGTIERNLQQKATVVDPLYMG